MKSVIPASSSRRATGLILLAPLLAALTAVSSHAQGGGGGGNQPPIQRDQTAPTNVVVRAFQPFIGAPGAFIRVNWARPKRVPSASIFGYVVRRNSFSGFQEVVGGIFGDRRGFIDTQATRTVSAYDGTPGSDDAGEPADFTATGIVAGSQYGYQISAAYQNGLQDRDGDGEPDDAIFMSPSSRGSGMVTAIEPPTIVAIDGSTPNNAQVQLREFQIDWQQTPGANQYVLWVGRDPGFRRRVQVPLGRTVPVDLGGDVTVSKVVSVARAKFRGARVLYIAVGARAARDPAPVPFGAIFSAPVAIQPLDVPPPPPGGGGGGGNPPPPPSPAPRRR